VAAARSPTFSHDCPRTLLSADRCPLKDRDPTGTLMPKTQSDASQSYHVQQGGRFRGAQNPFSSAISKTDRDIEVLPVT